MKYLSRALVLALPTVAFIGCGKKVEPAKQPQQATEASAERVSGPLPEIIAWEDVDGK